MIPAGAGLFPGISGVWLLGGPRLLAGGCFCLLLLGVTVQGAACIPLGEGSLGVLHAASLGWLLHGTRCLGWSGPEGAPCWGGAGVGMW